MPNSDALIKVYAARRWPWWRILLVSLLGIAFFVFLVHGASSLYEDPNNVRAYRNDTVVRVSAVFWGAVLAPYLLFLQALVTLQAIGRVPVLVLFTRGGVRHVASWLGWHRLSQHRMALPKTGALKVFTMQADPFKRQLVQVRCAGKMTRVQSYGVISEEDLAVVEAWVSGPGRT